MHHTVAQHQCLIYHLCHAYKEFGLKTSLKKTNVMAQDVDTDPIFTTDGHTLDVINNFTYLGSTISSISDTKITSRIANAAAVMTSMDK